MISLHFSQPTNIPGGFYLGGGYPIGGSAAAGPPIHPLSRPSLKVLAIMSDETYPWQWIAGPRWGAAQHRDAEAEVEVIGDHHQARQEQLDKDVPGRPQGRCPGEAGGRRWGGEKRCRNFGICYIKSILSHPWPFGGHFAGWLMGFDGAPTEISTSDGVGTMAFKSRRVPEGDILQCGEYGEMPDLFLSQNTSERGTYLTQIAC